MVLIKTKYPNISSMLLIPLIMLLTVVLVTYSHIIFVYGQKLSIALTLDLTVILPVLNYVVFRKDKASKFMSSIIFTAGVILSGYIIPAGQQSALKVMKLWIAPVIEILFIYFLVKEVKAVIKNHVQDNVLDNDFYFTLKRILNDIIPAFAAKVVAVEVAVFYYLFLDWKQITYDHRKFSYHKNSSSVALLLVLVFMIIIETSAIHLLLAKWSNTAAWILTIVSIYTALQISGIVKSMFKRPIQIFRKRLLIRYGIFAETDIIIDNIKFLEKSSKDADYDLPLHLSPLKKLESHNVIIHLNQEAKAHLLYGQTKVFKTLLLHVDNVDDFIQIIESQKQVLLN